MSRFLLKECARFISRPNKLQVLHRGFCVSAYRPSLTAPTPSALHYTDYETERNRFNLEVPTYYNFATDVIDKWADLEKNWQRQSTHPAFWYVDRSGNEIKWSFSELSERSKRAARALTGPCNVKPGDRILTILPKTPWWWIINLAAMRTGAVLIPGTTQLSVQDIQQRIVQSQATSIIVPYTMMEMVHEILKDCPGNIRTKLTVSPTNWYNDQIRGWMDFGSLYNISDSNHEALKTKSDDPMQILFTSGTTGGPKMTEHTHASYGLAHVITGRYWLDLVPQDVHWCQADPGWAQASWSSLFAPWIQGACVFVYDTHKFNPEETLQVLSKYPVSTFGSTPTAYRFMVQQDLSKLTAPSLRHCVSAGEPLNPEVVEKWYDGTGHILREGYEQTETVLQCCTSRYMPNKPGSMGKPPPGMDVRIINEEGEECADEEEGDMAVRVNPQRPVGFFTRYVDEPDRTAAAYRGDYYLSGDRAYRDEDGYLWIKGRSDDVIISSGYRIGPFEVESALLEHPAVAESAVVSSPDETHGQVVKAFVVLSKEYADQKGEDLATELQMHMKTTTEPHKYPRKIEFVDYLPKTTSGKMKRSDLRNREWEQVQQQAQN